MNTVIIIFMIVATIFALATLGYVTVDIVLEKRSKKKSEKENNEDSVTAI